MKLKNLMGAFLALSFAAFAPQAARAEVAQGAIYSIDLVEGGKYGGRVPTEDDPLLVGEKAVIRVRLVNANWQQPPASRVGNPRPWFIVPRYPGMEEFYPLQLGLMLGGQQVYADYLETQEVPNPESYYTDIYFSYTVKSGDLALPAYLMDAAGKPAGENGEPEYSLLHADMWKITNLDGADVTGNGLFHFTTQGAAMTPVPGEPQNKCISGRGMGLFAKTVDLDRNYAEPSETEGGKDIWRKIYQGMTTTTTILPSVAVDGVSQGNVFMYVWCDDPAVAAPLKSEGAKTVTDVIGGKTVTRSVLPVLIPTGASAVSFKLQGVGLGETKVKMSSSLNLVEDDMHVLVTNWVERIVQVVEPPAPFVAFNLIDKSGNPLLAPVTCPTGEGYQDYVAALTVTLSKAPTAAVTVHLNPTINGEEVDIFDEKLFGISTTTDGTPWVQTVKEVTFQAGETSKTLYIYSLGVIKDLASYGVKFTPSVTGDGKGMFDGDDHSHIANLIVKFAKPEIVSPTPEDAIEDAMAGQTYKLTVMLGDSFRDMRHENGYQFWYRISIGGAIGKWIGPADADNPTEPFFPDPDSGIGEVDVAFEDEGEGTLEIYMVNADKQDTRVKGQGVKIPVIVSAPKKAWAELDHPDGYYAEGETAKVKFFLSQKTPGSKTYYAFLVPVEDSVDSTNKFSSTGFSTSVPATGGCPISPGSTDSGAGVTEVNCLDGAAIGQYDVFICTQLSYNKTKKAGYTAGRLVINATNVAPRVESASIVDTAEVPASGSVVTEPIALGLPKKFRVSIGDTEPSQLDLDGELEEGGTPGGAGDNRFRTQWKFGTKEWVDVWGNPNADAAFAENTFTAAGDYVIKVRVQDKDMRKGNRWSPEFTFTVTVDGLPRLIITPSLEGKRTYGENETGEDTSSFNLDLSVAPKFNDPNARLVVDLEVTSLGAQGAADCVLSTTQFEFGSGDKLTRNFYLYELDGTTESMRRGFRITAKAQGLDEEGKKWENGSIDIKVDNVEPVIKLPAEQPKDGEGKVIPTETSINKEISLKWVLDDVDPDTNRMEVAWLTSDGQEMTYIQGEGTDTDRVKYLPDVMSGTHKFFFSSAGDVSITVTATDKDGGSSSRTIYYHIEPSKQLKLSAHGPAMTQASSGGFSMHYGAAAGLGAGHVYAGNGRPQEVKKWVHSYVVGESETSLDALAFGYRADGSSDNGSLDGADVAIDVFGNLAEGGTADFYTYSRDHKYGRLGYDSFLYGWACNNTASTAGTSGTGGTATGGNTGNSQHTVYSFLLNIGAGGSTALPLPAKETTNSGGVQTTTDSYPVQYWEAVFSREWLTTDNCGDINADGVPDWAVYTYGMGVVDTTTYKLITSESQTGTTGDEALPEGDLTDLKDWNKDLDKDGNEDPDYLPATDTSSYAAFIPGLKGTWVANGVEFGALREIRGYGDGLNDALELLGATDVTSDRVYEDPGQSPTSTLSKVEFLAWTEYAAKKGYDPADPTKWTTWSPERPTRPTKSDTDGDKMPDGYEYYFWYRAHVGYFDANGVHKYLTGRAYDPRNPGEGKFIDSATIALMMDPRSDLEPVDFPENFIAGAANAQTRDTDQDGLPDLLELELGTNPFDFDTDGDGLPDGWEVMISGTDPLKVFTTGNVSDAMRNFDGDAMAFTTPKLEGMQLPVPLHTDMLTSFALVKADGDTDGVQWYVGKSEPTGIGVLKDDQPGTSFTVGGVTYVTRVPVPVATNVTASFGGLLATTNVVIAADLPKEVTWTALSTNEAPEGVEVNAGLIALMPTRIPAGTPIDPKTEVAAGTYATLQFTNGVAGVNTAWIYGRETVSVVTTGDGLANQGGFGMRAIGRYEDAPKGLQIAALPAADENAAYLHYLVYQEFGFDPRTAWNANTPLAKRWGQADGEDGKANNYNSSYGYAGVATRTREYTAYDEFLVFSFFLNNGMTTLTYEVLGDTAPSMAELWYANTTNPQGPGEEIFTEGAESADSEDNPTEYKYWGRNSDNGADTDGDGVPDGWELYVMAGPKQGGKYHFAFPYADGYYSSFGPFEPDAAKSSFTDNSATSTNDSSGGDGDGLTELQEFAGTDSCAWYARPQGGNEKAFSTTIVRPAEHRTWMNKFFPTDPWDSDTDKDGITDGNEIKNWSWVGNPAQFRCGNFLYGTPVDNGSASIPGGGLNPLSIDTDGDGLPDLWEAQFAGQTPYAGPEVQYAKGVGANGAEDVEGNPRQGLCDGMDGTVADAFTYPIRGAVGTTNFSWTVVGGVNMVVNRDYDHDGLENWQEYMAGMMRCWRYDDPSSRWDYIPDDWYWNAEGAFAPKLEAFGFKSMDEFWTETLTNPQGRFYNPHLVSGLNPAKYMSRVKNGWDRAYTDEGSYYWMYDRIGDTPLAKLWGHAPLCYASCSPLDSDSDQDGMDDYYELFHGLNPLLGLSGKEATSGADDGMAEKRGPCDLIYSAYMGSGTTLEAWNAAGDGNGWQKDPALKAKSRSKVAGGYDFIVYPWLNGLQMADPDGDDIRNVNEAIMPKLATETWNHTDPTPLWMTDSSYSNSLVRLFFRMQTRFGEIPLSQYGADPCFSNTLTGATCYFRDCDGYRPAELAALKPPRFVAYNPDFWDLAAEDKSNWMYSFEENEGYDTDHDGSSDYEEGQGKYRSATDMQDFDSPRRRQAMYFPGKDAALQTPPLEIAHHPIDDTFKLEPEFLTYTVECWVMPEEAGRDQVILERAIWTDFSKPGDEEFMRKNFQFAIRNGKWYTKFDPNGTLANNAVEIYSTTAVEVGKWAHLAATYDGSTLNFYVNGVAQVPKTGLSLQPEHGESVLAVRTEYGFDYGIGDYWFDRDYGYQAFVIGASVRGRMGTGADGKPAAVNERGYLALDLSRGIGWSAYTEFFRGYVDEISVWDGARSFDDIVGDYNGRVRLDRTAAIENSSAFYKDWSNGKRRAVRGNTLVPELRYHWSFDSLFAAENPKVVAKVPHGFDIDYGAAYLSRPAGYTVDWWRKVVQGDAGTAGYGSVYAGRLDWVAWIPNTVAHLPFYDGTTLDSVLWSANYCGDRAGSFAFPRTAEPVSKWTQMTYNGVSSTLEFQTTGSRHRFVNDPALPSNSTQTVQFEFTNRKLDLCGADLLPLGGAFVKYCPTMWDDQGASSMWEQTQTDADNNGIADWWDEYADQNYRLDGTDSGSRIDWDEIVDYHGIPMTAGQAYLRDLAKGYYLDAYATMHPLDPEAEDGTEMKQTAKSDGMIPDWWKELMKIDGQEPLADTDNDGLNNYVEYVASELLPFRLCLDPRMARSDTTTLDYFRRVGRLYVGEMLTDHDQMEDHWERSLGDENVASATLWDALKDGEEDGWTNFAENRYSGYSMSILAQLVAHAMGDYEALDAPIPTLRMRVRYNGDRPLAASGVPPIVIRAFSKNAETGSYALKPDAVWSVTPGVETEEKSVYLGGWEDRVVRGTMGPGNINLDSVNIKFAQVPQSDLYSWTDESGLHLAKSYKEFKEALDKNQHILQNIQEFKWLELAKPDEKESGGFVASDKAVTVAREKLTQKAYIAVYGERVGTLDLTTGDFEFDLSAMNSAVRPRNEEGIAYTFDDSKGEETGWAYKEAIFKLVYKAKVPATQQQSIDFTLAKADKGFVRGGLNSIEVFYDLDGGTEGVWDPGEPFGVVNDVEIGWAGRDIELELKDMSAVTPRVDLWTGESDRGVRVNVGSNGIDRYYSEIIPTTVVTSNGQQIVARTVEYTNKVELTTAGVPDVHVTVSRYLLDGQPIGRFGLQGTHLVVLEREFVEEARTYLHEGDFLADGAIDIDWTHFAAEVVEGPGVRSSYTEVTNVAYKVTFDWDSPVQVDVRDTNTVTKMLSTLITRRFEKTRTIPTPSSERSVHSEARPTFRWKIVGEDPWAAHFGTTYTGFKVRVKDLKGKTVYDSGVRRLPAKDASGVYSWTAPLYVGEKAPGSDVVFQNLTDYTWEVALYNAKFATDERTETYVRGNPFSKPEVFRMNVTELDTSTRSLAVRTCYTGPAAGLLDCVRVQAFASPDFTGDPIAETTLRYVDIRDSLSPEGTDANAVLAGLPEGSYFLRAYIDTNGNGMHDEWESWGYLSERDQASKPGIFNPVALTAAYKPLKTNVRKLFIEDCDTDGDFFPDVWEAEQNGGVFVKFLRGKGQGPVDGDAELIGVNPELNAVLEASEFPMLEALSSKNGLALISGIPPTRISTVERSDGTLGISIDNKVESVKVTGFDFTAEGNVRIKIEAATTSGSVDGGVTALYGLSLTAEKKVTCKIYRKAKLSDTSWTLAGSSEVVVGGEPATITVPKPVAGNGGFYKAEIVE